MDGGPPTVVHADRRACAHAQPARPALRRCSATSSSTTGPLFATAAATAGTPLATTTETIATAAAAAAAAATATAAAAAAGIGKP